MSDTIYGKNSFQEALNAGRIQKAYVLPKSPFIRELERQKIDYEITTREKLDVMSHRGNHQGYLALVREFRFSTLEAMMKKENGLILILDGLKDPHNLGAIIRTCECAGVDGIVYKKNNSVRVNETVAKVASGAMEYVKIHEAVNLSNVLKKLKENGYWVVGTDGGATQLYNRIDYNMNVALVIGSEGEGMSRLIKEECDFMVKMPMVGHVNSLNASVAAGIMIYNILDKRS